jgi:hypothetical protein
MPTSHRRSLRLHFVSLVASVTCAYVTLASGQTAPIWNGSVRCDIDFKGPGYVSHETHTWTLTGAPPPDGAPDYPGTWTVSGTGSRVPTDTLRSAATWKTEGSAPGVRMAIFVRQSDQRLLVFPRHGQLNTANGTTGTEERAELGRRAQPQPISKSVNEWRPFPTIQDAATSTHLTGSSTTPLTRADASQPIGTSGQAVCSWNLVQGAAAGGATVAAGAALTGVRVENPTLAVAGTTATIASAPTPTTSTTEGRRTSEIAGTTGRVLTSLPGVSPRMITLSGFTAAGVFTGVPARTIALPGFTSVGVFTPIPPRTITLTGWTAAGP